jgi:flagellar biosynthesis/type III secretory pathway protein FliH
MEDFEKWLIDELEIQTLTDELKNDILIRMQDLYDDAYSEGYTEGYSKARLDIIDELTHGT